MSAFALSGTKLRSDFGNRSVQSPSVPAARSGRWRRTLLLAPALLSLFFLAAAEYDRSDASGAGKEGIVVALKDRILAALADPLAVLAARSPGSRGPGKLRMTKSRAAPYERVLSEVRERPVVIDLPPAAVAPVVAENAPEVASYPSVPPAESANNQSSESSFPTPVNSPFGLPGAPVSESGGTDTPPGGPGSGDIPPGGPGGIITPPGGTDTPGSPGGPDTPPPTIALPEPATWLSMILGLAVIVTMRRREGRRTSRLSIMEIECGSGCDH